MSTPLRLGTRASALALAQSGQVGREIAAHLPGSDGEVELVHVSTHGDRDRVSPLAQIGGTGVFVTAVREALLAGEVDAIVHSAKDLPTAAVPGIDIACIPAREDVRDALCARDGLTLETLPEGASIGTGSPRRAAQLLAARPDLRIVAIRGNIDTRLARALGPDADLDAVVLAAAGLRRLGRGDAISELIDPSVMLPAPAQGALAVERRTEEGEDLAAAMAAVDDPATRAAVTAERALLRTLEAGCSAPVAALGEITAAPRGAITAAPHGDGEHPVGAALRLRALAIMPDGSRSFPGELRAPIDLAADRGAIEAVASRLGADLAALLLADGAGAVLGAPGGAA